MYNNKWYLAVTLQTFPSTEEVKVSCLEPAGPAASFVYPRTPDILTIPAIDILTLVDPVTNSTGRCYRLSDTEYSKAFRVLDLQLRLSTSNLAYLCVLYQCVFIYFRLQVLISQNTSTFHALERAFAHHISHVRVL